VRLDAKRGLWYDHARGEGGGILDLIQRVMGCDRRAAVHWLANQLGVNLEDSSISAAEQRTLAQQRCGAERKARELAEWREEYLARLRRKRNDLWDAERDACTTALRLLAAGDDDSARWGAAWRHALGNLEGDAIDRQIDRVAGMSTCELMALRDRTPQELAA
jgi:hypothetical protein